ncbi:uncharacterized protein CTRU02_210155 [Colletotrichum truncatum]|uniref:Uncharacterized protein n=1 Tax=Colletotrichum truncatum TaxID=5467 RepID=A0ACC3YUF5_COLTU|nr:uncharacterized protein CTRU02_15584 [Colletotrichum truncatum]KAF6780878.1 hypothetical protein CTRU02_15584 [Colletotrichum truncatum]
MNESPHQYTLSETGCASDVPDAMGLQSPSSLPQPRMSLATVHEILYRIGQTFSHVQYAVCGTAAMIAYGFTDRLPVYVSIICPTHTKDVIKSWAVAGGMSTYSSEPDVIGVTVAGDEVWKIWVKYLAMDQSHRFDRLETVGMAFGGNDVTTQVLTMPALLNQIAMRYIDGRESEPWRYREKLAGDAVWLLERICESHMPEQSLMGARISSVRDPAFWLVFTTAHPETVEMFYNAGLRDDDEESVGDWGWIEGEEDVQPRIESSMSSHAPLLQPKEQRDTDSDRTPSRGSSRAHDRHHANGGSRFSNCLRRRPNLTRAEERRVLMDGRSRTFRRRSSGGGRRLSKVFCLSGTFDEFLRTRR